MKTITCDWCQLLIPKDLEEQEEVFVSRQVGGNSSDDYEEYDLHRGCSHQVMRVMREVMFGGQHGARELLIKADLRHQQDLKKTVAGPPWNADLGKPTLPGKPGEPGIP